MFEKEAHSDGSPIGLYSNIAEWREQGGRYTLLCGNYALAMLY